MKLIIPMAGRGTRLRPHTLTVPKPLIPIAGKPIVERLVEDLVGVCAQKVEEIVFITGDFGDQVEQDLLAIAARFGAKGTVVEQVEKLGTAHAVLCAGDALSGNVIVAFADTLFRADFELDAQKDGIVWVKQVNNPSAYGVVKYDKLQVITDFVEKPEEFVSDLAIIGIYYFKDGANLRSELQYLIDHDVRIKGGEFGLTTALENMKNKGLKLTTGRVKDWLDCGNKQSTVETNTTYLGYLKGQALVSSSAKLTNSVVIQPSFVGDRVLLENAVVGPYASIGEGTIIKNSVVKHSIVQHESMIENKILVNSMIGSKSILKGKAEDLSVGDYTEIKS